MLYPKNLEQKIGFDSIREYLKNSCLSTLGKDYTEKMRFSTDFDLIQKLLHQTNDFKGILEQQLLFPTQNFIDVRPLLEKVKIEGSFLESSDFFEIKLSLKTIYKCLEFFKEAGDAFIHLKKLTEGINIDQLVFRRIEDIIDDKGLIRDDASEELHHIRKEIIAEQSKIRKELERILSNLKKDGYADEDVSITIRNGRMVIPVFAEHKRKIRGFIHGESGTGQTVFLEPAQVLEINNEIQDLFNREKREVIRILTELSSFLRMHLFDLGKAYTFLGLIDFIRAKAKLSLDIQGHMPALKKAPFIQLKEARHPLLVLNQKNQGKKVIPLDILLDEKQRIIIISGPNAGGKSVTLKTVGLLQYMLQCGLLIPSNEGSCVGIFNDILIDIGDEQSLDNDLSTYSSHLQNMKQFLFYSNKRSLILIDEFGTGTEPHLGAAISEAVLEKLNQQKVYGIITTHYANLKTVSEKAEGIVNGAMVFDLEKLEPLYELEIGKPGSSFAMEIARKIGLPDEVIENSKTKIGKGQVDFERLVQDLEREKVKYKKLNEQIESRNSKLEEDLLKYQRLNDHLEKEKKKYLDEAKEKAKELLKTTNQKIENTIRKIKESNADKAITNNLRKDIQKFEEDFLTVVKEEEILEVVDYEGGLKEGDYVKIKGSGAVGKVLLIKEKNAEVIIGNLKSNTKIDRLEKISRKDYKKLGGEENSSQSKGIDINEKVINFYPIIDVRGKRSEEALSFVDNLIDSALLTNASEVKIIHGKGDGILRTMIRSQLKNYPQVLSIADEHADRGGDGATIVYLR